MDNFDDKYKKKNPFSVPEGYFDNFTDRMVKKVNEQQTPQKPKLLQMLRPYLGLVGIFLLALLIVQTILPLVVDKSQLLVKDNDRAALLQENVTEDIFDSQFNPTNEEIIEYLASEADNYEFVYAGIY